MDEVTNTNRTLNAIIDDAAEIVRGFGKGPKNPIAIARLLSLCDESALATQEFARRVRCNMGSLYLWRKGQTSSQKPWPALAAEIAKRNGASLAASMNAELASAPEAVQAAAEATSSPVERAKQVIKATRGESMRADWDKHPEAVAEIVRLHQESGMQATPFLEAIRIDPKGKLGAALGLRHQPRAEKAAAKMTKAATNKRAKTTPPKRAPKTTPPSIAGVAFDGNELRVARTSPAFRAALLAALGLHA